MNVAELEKSTDEDDDSEMEETESDSEEEKESFADMVERVQQEAQKSEYIKCKACSKLIEKKSLVRHLVQPQKKHCRSVYGEEFIDNWKKQSTRESKKKYKEKNKEAIRSQKSEYAAQYYEKNKQKFKERYGKNKERIKEYLKKNKGRIKETSAKRYQQRKVEVKEEIKRGQEEMMINCDIKLKAEMEDQHRDSNLSSKKYAEKYLKSGSERLKDSNDFILKFTEFQNAIEERYKKIEKEINLIAQKAAESKVTHLSKMYDEVTSECKWHDVYIQIDISLAKFSKNQGQSHRCQIPPGMILTPRTGISRCSNRIKCSCVYEPQADICFYSLKEDEKKHIIRKGKSFYHVDELEKSMDEEDDPDMEEAESDSEQEPI